MSDGPLYLGLDLSTQQLKAIVIQSDLHVVAEAKVSFDEDFGSKYGVEKGVLMNKAEGEVFAPVAMWLESLDLVLNRLKEKNTPLNRIRGISGSCQQHGSVYWSHKASDLLAGLTADKPLVEQLKDAFSYPYGPNWQDHSTQHECDQFDVKLGSPQRLAEVTGSAAHHRFTGPQIMRLRPTSAAWTSGTSLGGDWSEPLLELTAGGADGAAGLRRKLGEVRKDGGGSMGAISRYFVSRYGFSADCQISPFTGDNPATILALPLRPGDAIVSLGTSTTFLMVTPVYKPDPSYHFFNHPTTPGQYMFMLCYKNGALAREKVRDALPGTAQAKTSGDPWAAFNAAALSTPPLDISNPATDRAKLGLYFYLPEIVPNIRAGTWRFTSLPDGTDLREETSSTPWPVETDPRIIVESQALSMRLRSQNLVYPPPDRPQLPAQPRRVYLVGGGSLNPAIARVLGDVLGGAEGVYRLDVGGNACALGGAYKALWSLERSSEAQTFDELIGQRWKEEGAIQRIGDGYREGVFEGYGKILKAFEEMEGRVLEVARNT
ncbi:hypothetical protein VTJ04DRAFT_3802 [Mycothermus thermophilus]|uniref:uncharacterized protein n=1 Tax=Humicola insolens TaxID=85995 RepID=UPI003742809E